MCKILQHSTISRPSCVFLIPCLLHTCREMELKFFTQKCGKLLFDLFCFRLGAGEYEDSVTLRLSALRRSRISRFPLVHT